MIIIENHIHEEGFNMLLEAILPISENISEITLSRELISFFHSFLENDLSTANLTQIGQLIHEDKLRNLTILDLSCNDTSIRITQR